MSVELLERPPSCFEIKPTAFELDQINSEFAELNPLERVIRAHELFPDCLVLSTTFGPTAPVMLKLATDVIPDIPVINIQHGYETDRTKELTDWYTEELRLNLNIYEAPRLPIPPEGTAEFAEFQRALKVEPFQEMLDDLRPSAYLSGMIRWQTPERESLPFIQDNGSVLAINPVLDLSREEVDEFFARTGFPENDDYFDPTKGVSQQQECQLNTNVYK